MSANMIMTHKVLSQTEKQNKEVDTFNDLKQFISKLVTYSYIIIL